MINPDRRSWNTCFYYYSHHCVNWVTGKLYLCVDYYCWSEVLCKIPPLFFFFLCQCAAARARNSGMLEGVRFTLWRNDSPYNNCGQAVLFLVYDRLLHLARLEMISLIEGYGGYKRVAGRELFIYWLKYTRHGFTLLQIKLSRDKKKKSTVHSEEIVGLETIRTTQAFL